VIIPNAQTLGIDEALLLHLLKVGNDLTSPEIRQIAFGDGLQRKGE
jgi:hypothetical protein